MVIMDSHIIRTLISNAFAYKNVFRFVQGTDKPLQKITNVVEVYKDHFYTDIFGFDGKLLWADHYERDIIKRESTIYRGVKKESRYVWYISVTYSAFNLRKGKTGSYFWSTPIHHISFEK